MEDEDIGKRKRKVIWDDRSKKYKVRNVDPNGKVLKEKDEGGKRFNNKEVKETRKDIFERWKKQTHLRIQKSSEMEDPQLVEGARRNKLLFQRFKNKHK